MPKQKYSAGFKVRTVLESLKSPDGIAAYCRRSGISEVQFCQWQKKLLDNADALFDRMPKAVEKRINQLEDELKRKGQIIAVVTEEALDLKKTYEVKRYKHLSLEIKLDHIEMLHRYIHYGWTKKAICRKWNISVQTFCSLNKELPKTDRPRRVQLNAITNEEKQQVIGYALTHTELNYREMSYRMIDEDIAGMGPSSVYSILRENNLLQRRQNKEQPSKWNPHARLSGPDEVWQTDLMVVKFKGRDYYSLTYFDVYSRFAVYHELCLSMTGDSIKQASQRAIRQTGKNPDNIQSDNGSCYISTGYRSFITKSEIEHHRIHPCCPNENAEIERYHRTLRELIDTSKADSFKALNELFKGQIYHYNHARYHSAIGFMTPNDKYNGRAEAIIEARKRKLQKAKERRIKANFQRIQMEKQDQGKLAA